MVHSWVTAGTSSVSTIQRTAPIKSGRAGQRQHKLSHQWKLAKGLFFLFSFLVLFSGFALMQTSASSGEATPATIEDVVISVDSGDTLWQLARTYKKSSLDTRQAVHVIMEHNDLTSSDVKIGQTLVIPSRILP